MSAEENAKVFKALCDEKRIGILQQLVDGEKCACVLLEDLDFTQSGLSYQMKILCESGLVKGRRDGKWIHYSIDKDACFDAAELLLKITGANLKCGETKSKCCCKSGEKRSL